MPVISRLPGGVGGSGSGGTSELSLNIFTQPDEPETKDGLWIRRANTHKKIVVDNLISASGEWSDIIGASIGISTDRPIVFNDRIVMFDNSYNLWSFDGGIWAQMGESVDGANGALCVIGSTLYCVSGWAPTDSSGSTWGPVLFKWTGSTWTKVCNIPASDTDTLLIESVVVYNNYIYLFKIVTNSSSGVRSTQLLRSSGSSFSTIATSNYTINIYGNGFVLNNTIYWLGSYWNNDVTVDVDRCLITSTGSNISLPSSNSTPFSNNVYWTADVFDSVTHMFVEETSGVYKHYAFDGSIWTKLFDMEHTTEMWLCGYNTRLYAFNRSQYMYYSKTHDKYPEHTLILQIADSHDGPYETALVNTTALVTNGRFVTKFDDVFFVGESGLETTDPIYYGDGSKWVKFKN